MKYRYVTLDVFTDEPFGGNPLAVVPEAQGLRGEQMQQIAREFNYSETVFVLPADGSDHDARVRIFTPARELPFAGHPTIGTAHVLAAAGNDEPDEIVLGEGVGPVPVRITWCDGRPVAGRLTLAGPGERDDDVPDPACLAAILSLEGDEIGHRGMHPAVVSCGIPFLLVPLAGSAAVRRAKLVPAVWEEHLMDTAGENVYLFAVDGCDVHARMFGPAVGVPEDPATGSAAVAVAAYLGAAAEGDGTHRWNVAQGLEMGRPSRLQIEAVREGGAVTATRVGGASVPMCTGEISIP
jgi:trans-2,3-dihydro-3-hydroxyanthranilate isomerase